MREKSGNFFLYMIGLTKTLKTFCISFIVKTICKENICMIILGKHYIFNFAGCNSKIKPGLVVKKILINNQEIHGSNHAAYILNLQNNVYGFKFFLIQIM